MTTNDVEAPGAPSWPIHRAVWSWWQALNWLLPIVAAVLFAVLMPPSPGLLGVIPVTLVAIALGSLPRVVLRLRRATTMPPPVTGLVLLNAWCWTVVVLVPVFLSRWLTLFDGVERVYMAVVVMAGIAWVALLVMAIFVPLDARPSRRWTTLAWVAALATPFALVGILAVGLLLIVGAR